MALRKAETFECELPGGGVVTLRMTLPVQARIVAMLQSAEKELGQRPKGDGSKNLTPEEVEYLGLQATMVAGQVERLADAFVTWREVEDYDGKPFPFHTGAIKRLDLTDAIAVVVALVEHLDIDATLTRAAADAGAEDPTAQPPERT